MRPPAPSSPTDAANWASPSSWPLQAAVAVVLHKAGSGVDIPLGTPVAGRTEAELDQLIGFFVNILVLRNDLRGNPTLREVLTRAREDGAGRLCPPGPAVRPGGRQRQPGALAVAQPAVSGRSSTSATTCRPRVSSIGAAGQRRPGHGVHLAGPGFRHGARRSERQLLRHRRLRRCRGYHRQLDLPHRALPAEHHRAVGRLADSGRHASLPTTSIRVCGTSC